MLFKAKDKKQKKGEKTSMKTKSMFVGMLLAIFALPLMFVFASCGEEETVSESKVALTSDMIYPSSSDFTYDGEIQKPVVEVKIKQPRYRVFVEGVDYTIEWENENSTNVKTGDDMMYHYTVKAVATSTKLEGQAEGTYYIGALNLSNKNDNYVDVVVDPVTFDLSHVGGYEPAIQIKNAKTGTVMDNSLFNIGYANNTVPTAAASVTISPRDISNKNIKGQTTQIFEIKKASMSNATITFNGSDTFETFFTGQPITVNDVLKVSYRTDEDGNPIYIPYGEQLDQPTDELKYGFTVEYDPRTNVSVGTAKLKVRAHALNPYLQGEVEKTFTISKCVFDDSFEVVTDKENYYYTASVNAPQLTVTSPKVMTEGNVVADTNYTKEFFRWQVIPENNNQEGWVKLESGEAQVKNVGHYKVVINGRGNFEGSLEKEFEIRPTDITGGTIKFVNGLQLSDTFSKEFTGYDIMPDAQLSVSVGGVIRTFNSGSNVLRVEYSNTKDAASIDDINAPTIKFVGENGFVGTVEKKYEITPVNLSSNRVVVGSIENQVFSNTEKTPAVSITLLNGNANTYQVGAGEVEVEYGTNKFGQVPVTITSDSGNFVGSTSTSFNIVAANLVDAQFDSIADQDFDFENEITLTDQDLTASFNGYDLEFGTDFSVSYENNIHAGTATITIEGAHYFEGTVLKTFRINPIDYEVLTDGAELTAIEENEKTFDLVGNSDFTQIVVNAQNVTVASTAKDLLYSQSIVVKEGKSLTLNRFVGGAITNENLDQPVDFNDENFDIDDLTFFVTQNGIRSKEQLEQAFVFANFLKLGADINETVEFLAEIEPHNNDTMILSNEEVFVVRKFDLNGYSLRGGYYNYDMDESTNSNFVVKANKIENLSVYLFLTNDNEDTTRVSCIGGDGVDFGLELRGGVYAGEDEEIKDMNLAIFAKNLTFRGSKGGLLTDGNYENTFDFDHGTGIMFVAEFENCRFEATEYDPYNYYNFDPESPDYPAAAIFNANAQIGISNSKFVGPSGIFARAGNLFVSNGEIKATAENMKEVDKAYGSGAEEAFGTGSGLIVESKDADTAVNIYIENSSISSAGNYAIEQYSIDGISENTIVMLDGVTLSGFTKQYQLENQPLKGSSATNRVLIANNVVVEPTENEAFNSALLNDGYKDTIINQINVYQDVAIENIEEILVDKVVVFTGAVLTLDRYYTQIETRLIDEYAEEKGKINFVAETAEEVLSALDNEFFDIITLSSGNSYELTIETATPTRIEIPENVSVTITSQTVASELDKINFYFSSLDSTLTLEDYFGENLHINSFGVEIRQENVTTAAALKDAVAYAKYIVLGDDIDVPQSDGNGHNDYRLTLFENTTTSFVTTYIDTNGFDINGYLILSAAYASQNIYVEISNTQFDAEQVVEPGETDTNTTMSVVGGENATCGIAIFGGYNSDELDEELLSCTMQVVLNGIVVKGKQTGLATCDKFVQADMYSLTITATNCTFRSIDKVLEEENDEFGLAGLYAPGYAIYDFSNCLFYGGTGVYVKGGEISFDGCNIYAAASINHEPVQCTGDYRGTGSALVVDTDTHYSTDMIVVNVVDSTLYSNGRHAIEEFTTFGEINEETTINLAGTLELYSALDAIESEDASALSYDENVVLNEHTIE